MRILLVGTRDQRARLAAELDRTTLTIVGEFATLAGARASGIDADAMLIGAGRTLAAVGARHFDDRGPDDVEEPLTARELQVLELMAEGLTNKTIAARLGISDQTVKFHIASIGGKLGAANRTDAVRRAVRRGLVAL
jgi:DNA-binding NarL/FixJ family response regulator